MKKIEDKIWDTITNSAKKKFDYASFKKNMPQFAEMVLFKVIVDFATNKPLNVVALELYNQVLLTGFIWKMEDINIFLTGKKDILNHEIYIAQMAAGLLQDGESPESVYTTIIGLL